MNEKEIARLIKAAAAEYEQRELEMLERICSFDCGTAITEGNAKVIEILSDFFAAAGIGFETVDAGEYGRHFVARVVPDDPKGKIVLNAHIDTAFKRGDAEKNPVCIDDEGWLHGCGVSDCKGGVVISANAVKLCKELGILPDYEIAMVYNCDEEIGSPSGQKLFEKEAANASCVYAFEPSRDEDGILTSRMGHGECTLEVFGRQAHPAMYWTGASATECLIKLCDMLYEKQKSMKHMYFNVGDIESSSVNIMAPHAKAEICFRINEDNLYDDTKALLEDVFSRIPVDGCTVKYSIRELFPLMRRCDTNVRMLRHMQRLGREFMDWELPEQGTYGAGDACFFSKLGVPSVCGLGTYMANPHTLNEKCRIDSLSKRTTLMALTLALFDDKVLEV